MLGLVGIKKNVEVSIREKLALSPRRQNILLEKLMKKFEEAIILSTCNRTEIYLNGDCSKEEIFEILEWDKELMQYVFIINGKAVVKHLFELSCGFHSKILGEDQILGQIRESYEIGIEKGSISSELMRLVEDALSCGKKFRNNTKLYEIPVSASSISVNKLLKSGCKKVMVMGYGVMGTLVVKYLLGSDVNEINLVVRDKMKIEPFDDDRVKIMDYDESRKVVNEMDGVISCTAATHLVLTRNHLKEEGQEIILIDLAMPRDIDETLSEYKRVELYDIDQISKLDDENKQLRVKRMADNRYIIDEYIDEYMDWLHLRGISSVIKEFKYQGKVVIDDRVKSYKKKSKSQMDLQLAETLIKSTADYYVNRAIKVLKEERLKGREEECLKILKEIFMGC